MTYYWLSTIQLDADSPVRRLTEAIRLNRHRESASVPEMYVTNVYRCDRIGVVRGNPLYECTYETLAEAQHGHRETLEKMREGRLKYRPIA